MRVRRVCGAEMYVNGVLAHKTLLWVRPRLRTLVYSAMWNGGPHSRGKDRAWAAFV